MLNKYPLWKNLLILAVLGLGFFYAAPNLYAPDPALQISGQSSTQLIDEVALRRVTQALDAEGLLYFGAEVGEGNKNALVRLKSADEQLPAQRVLQKALGDGYIVALNLAPTTPDWLSDYGAQPMKLGLDLSGGVHFLLEVDVAAAIERRLEFYTTGIKRALREKRIRGRVSLDESSSIVAKFRTGELRDEAADAIADAYPELTRSKQESEKEFLLTIKISEAKVKEIADYAVDQNLTTLRNRVNELGVSEPLVQKQGSNRIVVELPGIQDTAEAKRILGKTANLEFRLEARYDDVSSSKEEFEFRDQSRGVRKAFLERAVVITGERVANAQASFDENGRPQVNISLDSEGGALMHRATRNNIKRGMASLFIERKNRTRYELDENGEETVIKMPYDEKKIINLATIQSALGAQFRITGLDSTAESSELALLLRAGALAAPIDFVEERTVGPSLGAENIAQGVKSVQIGLALVMLFMLFYYQVFGIAAIVALSMNLILLIACMSMLSATLTLPGIAGIVLTVGMAVDANVLIFARIREELKHRVSPQLAIHTGYGRAFVTIMDANITTLLVALILYAVGTGPVRGFAVTLSIGIITSMFTAIVGTRAIVNLIYGGRNTKSLAIGWGNK
jgi:preprotein translocase subunit SecD